MAENLPSQNAPQHPATYTTKGEVMETMISQLSSLMTAEYGSRFQVRVDTDQTRTAWAARWRLTFKGKTKRRIMEAIDICFRNHEEPFTTGQFEAVYGSCTHATEKQPLQIWKPETSADKALVVSAIREMLETLDRGGGKRRTQKSIEDGVWNEEDEARFLEDAIICGFGQKKDGYHAPGSARACAYPGCTAGGTMAHSVGGAEKWYCCQHFNI